MNAIRRLPLVALVLVLSACTVERDRPRTTDAADSIAALVAHPDLAAPGPGGTLFFRLADGRVELASRRFQ